MVLNTCAKGWFGFRADTADSRGSFKGMTARDIYTKAAHFALLREMLPPGRIVPTTEQEGTQPAILPHVFEEEIRADRFIWLAMAFNRTATKPEILRKVKGYRKAWSQFHDDGMYDGQLEPGSDAETITRAFIAEHTGSSRRARSPRSACSTSGMARR